MSEERASTGSSAASYFLLGLGLGSLISVLLAPQSNAEARGYVSHELKEGNEYARKKRYDLRERVAALDEHDEKAKAAGVDTELMKQAQSI